MKKLLATFLILCATPVWAEWVLHSTTAHGVFFYDPTTIRGDNLKRVWQKTNFIKPTKETKTLSINTLEEIDCNEGKIRLLQSQSYSGKDLTGEITGATTTPWDWRYIPPNTPSSEVFQLVCKKKL